MIPHGRPVVDSAGAAELLGKATKTFTNSVSRSPGFPAPVNPGRRRLLYDVAQVEAYRDMRPIPALPRGRHADDLLDELDAAEALGVKYATVRKDRDVGRLPPGVDVCGVVHWRRYTLAAVLAARPGQGVGGGRPRKTTTREEEL